LIWVAVLENLVFLIAHAVYLRYFSKAEECAGGVSPTSHTCCRSEFRYALAARLFHRIMAASNSEGGLAVCPEKVDITKSKIFGSMLRQLHLETLRPVVRVSGNTSFAGKVPEFLSRQVAALNDSRSNSSVATGSRHSRPYWTATRVILLSPSNSYLLYRRTAVS
jgi:hypothetical protein